MYRQEIVEAQKLKLHGDVFLTQPVSFSFITFIIAAIVALAAVLIFTGSYARSERVAGYLVPSKGLVRIQASQFGSLSKLYVKEGEVVHKGQKIADIKVSQKLSGGRSVAEINIKALEQQQTVLKTQITLEQNQLESEQARLASEKSKLKLRVTSLVNQIALQDQITASAKAAYKDIQDILEKGFISKAESERRKQTWLSQQAQGQLKTQELAETTARLEQLDIRLKHLPVESMQRLSRLETQLSELDARKADQRGRLSYSITAPIDGRIVSINSGSVGHTVQTGQPLFSIMPKGSRLDAELFVPTRAIGFVESGQEVRLLYDAFPYQRFGSYSAKVKHVTETVLAPNELFVPFKINEPVYRVTAILDTENISARGKKVDLQSGMTLQANIVLERHSFLDWILTPLRAVGGRV